MCLEHSIWRGIFVYGGLTCSADRAGAVYELRKSAGDPKPIAEA
jgi:hypothetical protein